MEPDYPASHSMDTYWYAVDQLGHVAVCPTGESGHLPEEAQTQADSFGTDDLQKLFRPDLEPAAWDDRDYEEVVGDLGLFCFTAGDEEFEELVPPYVRVVTPAVPLHVDQLPPQWRRLLRRFSFPSLNFSSNTLLQPLELCECLFWYDADLVAFLCGDGKTVRPLPGKEEQYRTFYRLLLQDHPGRARQLQFEGLEEGE